MQYRGDVFRQRRQARDWTVATLLRDPDQGLGLEVATDSRTDEAARRALPGLLDLNLEAWRGRPLGAEDFNKVMVADDVRDLLLWISDPDVAKGGKTASAWAAFRDIVKREYGVDVDEKGALQKSVERLIKRKSGWSKVWNRLAEAPVQFRPVCERIRAATPEGDLLRGLGEGDPATNPHDNAIAEKMLEQDLSTLSSMSPSEASKKVVALEERHRGRRDTLWARLGEAPLARALEPLARLAAATEAPVGGDALAAIAAAYAEDGWRVDAALIETIAAAGTREELVARASGALYRPWVDALARRFRAAVEAAGSAGRPTPLTVEPGHDGAVRRRPADGYRPRGGRKTDGTGCSRESGLASRACSDGDSHMQTVGHPGRRCDPWGWQSERLPAARHIVRQACHYGRAAQDDAGARHSGARQGRNASRPRR